MQGATRAHHRLFRSLPFLEVSVAKAVPDGRQPRRQARVSKVLTKGNRTMDRYARTLEQRSLVKRGLCMKDRCQIDDGFRKPGVSLHLTGCRIEGRHIVSDPHPAKRDLATSADPRDRFHKVVPQQILAVLHESAVVDRRAIADDHQAAVRVRESEKLLRRPRNRLASTFSKQIARAASGSKCLRVLVSSGGE